MNELAALHVPLGAVEASRVFWSNNEE